MADKADPERQKRLDALQMVRGPFLWLAWATHTLIKVSLLMHLQADLGTARREYISTADSANKYPKATLEQLEANRKANQKGTEAHRTMQKNSKEIDAWRSKFSISFYFFQSICESHVAKSRIQMPGKIYRMTRTLRTLIPLWMGRVTALI
jgi:hypothetical protein